jgi:hypothetical protein
MATECLHRNMILAPLSPLSRRHDQPALDLGRAAAITSMSNVRSSSFARPSRTLSGASRPKWPVVP